MGDLEQTIHEGLRTKRAAAFIKHQSHYNMNGFLRWLTRFKSMVFRSIKLKAVKNTITGGKSMMALY